MHFYINLYIYITTCLNKNKLHLFETILKYDFCSKMLQIYISQSDTERWAINLIRALEKGRRRDLKELVEELVFKK